MAETDTTRFPFINLEKSLARARQLYAADMQARPLRVVDAFLAWQYSPKSSGGFQTISALKMYGLLEDFGANEDRKVKLTDIGRRFFVDEREEERAKMLRQFALSPKLIEAVYRKWGASPPADNIARSQLKLDWNLQEQSARAFLGIYKENLDFSGLLHHDVVPKPDDLVLPPPNFGPSTVSDIVQRPHPPAAPQRETTALADGERVVFWEETEPTQYLRLIASGEIDDAMLEALESYAKRQRAKLAATAKRGTFAPNDPQKPNA